MKTYYVVGMSLEEELRKETEKWLEKIKKVKIKPLSEKGKEFLRNIEAYIKDCEYFLEKGDLIRAFECVVWAWAWLEIGRDIGILAD
jgi:hypothetical protein